MPQSKLPLPASGGEAKPIFRMYTGAADFWRQRFAAEFAILFTGVYL